MKGKTYWVVALAGVVVAALAAGLLGRAQYTQSGVGVMGQQGQVGPRQQGGLSSGVEVDPIFGEKRLHLLNADRQKSMVSDADKLLKLARQLDAEVASNPTDELTPEEMRKVAEIEKLARSVKTKMAQSFTGGPQVSHPMQPLGAFGED